MISYKERKALQSRHVSPVRKAGGVVAALLLVAVLLLCYFTVRKIMTRLSADFYYPFLKTVRKADDFWADRTLSMQSRKTLEKAVRKLMRENAELISSGAVLEDLKKENQELRGLLNLPKRTPFRPVFAEVVARNPVNWYTCFTIDKGSADGVEPGNLVTCQSSALFDGKQMPVVIGKVLEVSKHTAQVCTVLNDHFRLSVSLPGTRSSGILKGVSDHAHLSAKLTYLPMNVSLQGGELVCTNHYSGNSPPGLPVGKIIRSGGNEAAREHDHVYYETDVKLFASPAEVRFTAVYVRERP